MVAAVDGKVVAEKNAQQQQKMLLPSQLVTVTIIFRFVQNFDLRDVAIRSLL